MRDEHMKQDKVEFFVHYHIDSKADYAAYREFLYAVDGHDVQRQLEAKHPGFTVEIRNIKKL